MLIAILITGHLRTFRYRYDSLMKNIILPLKEIGKVDIYVSTWDVIGYREGMNISQDQENFFEDIKLLRDLESKIDIEKADRDKFQREYNSEGWRKNPHLSGPQTAGDASSMWYKIYRGIRMIEDKRYDLILRTRPDIEYLTMIDINEIIDSLKEKVIYVPKFDGRYNEVRKGMVDHLAFGDYDNMIYYCSLFERIKEYLNDDNCIHTGEGFLAHHLSSLKIKRTELEYQVINKF